MCGFGLIFGLYICIDSCVQEVLDVIYVGNIYVNCNQIGVVVGSQFFGGEGLLGIGFKVGGLCYVLCFFVLFQLFLIGMVWKGDVDLVGLICVLQVIMLCKIDEWIMFGFMGELNCLFVYSCGLVLCFGFGCVVMQVQVMVVQCLGGLVVFVDGVVDLVVLVDLEGIVVVLWWGDEMQGCVYVEMLVVCDGQIV